MMGAKLLQNHQHNINITEPLEVPVSFIDRSKLRRIRQTDIRHLVIPKGNDLRPVGLKTALTQPDIINTMIGKVLCQYKYMAILDQYQAM